MKQQNLIQRLYVAIFNPKPTVEITCKQGEKEGDGKAELSILIDTHGQRLDPEVEEMLDSDFYSLNIEAIS